MSRLCDLLCIAVVSGLVFAAAVPAQAGNQSLIDAAKKERQVTWYTTETVDQMVRPAAAAFENKYGIKVNYVRAGSSEIALRVGNEARAGHVVADVVDGTTTSMLLEKQDYLEKWVPPNALPRRFVDPRGYWIATNQYVMTPGINTDLVPKGAEPQNWKDLLDPKWKGKMAWGVGPSASAAQGFVGVVLAEWGEQKGRAYLQQLANQHVAGIASEPLVLNQLISGEYSLAIVIFNNHLWLDTRTGAPVKWLKMEPALATLSVASLTRNSLHPNAGKLFLEFLVSSEGQKIIAEAGELPVEPSVPAQDPNLRPDDGHFRAIYFTPDQLLTKVPEWTKVYNEIFD